MKHQTVQNGVVIECRDDDLRVYSRWDDDGELIEERPYTEDENIETDMRAASYALMSAKVELERKIALFAAPEELAEVQRLSLASEGMNPNDEWRLPQGVHDAYPKDWIVTHNGKTWVSIVDANVQEPGVSGWREVVGEGEGCPEYVFPSGSHDAYRAGECVTFNGEEYVSVVDNNSWSPAEYPQGWQKKEAAA